MRCFFKVTNHYILLANEKYHVKLIFVAKSNIIT